MARLGSILAVLFLFGAADTTDVQRAYYLCPPRAYLSAADSISEMSSPPELVLVFERQGSANGSRLSTREKLDLIRYVDGEFARVVHSLPSGKKGFRVVVGKPLDEKSLQQAVANSGAAANPGDTVQITNLDFREKEIVVEINGGGRKKFRLREHLQIGIGGAPYPTTTTASNSRTARGPAGTTIILDYGRPLPDMGPDDVKKALSPLLDFSKEHSAAVNWIDTLPAEFKKAIQEHRAIVGMNQDMVVAALGRPDHKVRERNEQGNETEDWIYGTPPAKTTFVTFLGEKVTRVRVFNDAR